MSLNQKPRWGAAQKSTCEDDYYRLVTQSQMELDMGRLFDKYLDIEATNDKLMRLKQKFGDNEASQFHLKSIYGSQYAPSWKGSQNLAPSFNSVKMSQDFNRMHTLDYRENNGLIQHQSKNLDRPRFNQFQSSITTLPGPSITIRNDQRPFSRSMAQTVEVQRLTQSTPSGQSKIDQSDCSSRMDDNISVASSKSSFKNQIPRYYGVKLGRESIPE